MLKKKKKSAAQSNELFCCLHFGDHTSGFLHVLKISFFAKNTPFHGINTVGKGALKVLNSPYLGVMC